MNFSVVLELCGDNKQCQYDYSVTGNEQIAKGTMKFIEKFKEIESDVQKGTELISFIQKNFKEYLIFTLKCPLFFYYCNTFCFKLKESLSWFDQKKQPLEFDVKHPVKYFLKFSVLKELFSGIFQW